MAFFCEVVQHDVPFFEHLEVSSFIIVHYYYNLLLNIAPRHFAVIIMGSMVEVFFMQCIRSCKFATFKKIKQL